MLTEASDVLSELKHYSGADQFIRAAINNPSAEQNALTWEALMPRIRTLRRFYFFSQKIGTKRPNRRDAVPVTTIFRIQGKFPFDFRTIIAYWVRVSVSFTNRRGLLFFVSEIGHVAPEYFPFGSFVCIFVFQRSSCRRS